MRDRVNVFPRLLRLAAAASVTLVLVGGCEETVHLRGNTPDPEVVAKIKPGVSKMADVTRLIGSPSTVATFDKETWYYIGGKEKTVSFFEPELLERQVLTVQFDKKGVVTAINERDASKDADIAYVDRETPTRGKELTIIQQLLGNVGRFGTPKSTDDDQGGF